MGQVKAGDINSVRYRVRTDAAEGTIMTAEPRQEFKLREVPSRFRSVADSAEKSCRVG